MATGKKFHLSSLPSTIVAVMIIFMGINLTLPLLVLIVYYLEKFYPLLAAVIAALFFPISVIFWVIVGIWGAKRAQRLQIEKIKTQTEELLTSGKDPEHGKRYHIEVDGKTIEFIYGPRDHSGEYVTPSYVWFEINFPVDIQFCIRNETGGDRFIKNSGFGREYETGDTAFDKCFFVQSHSDKFIQEYLADPKRRQTMLDLAEMGINDLQVQKGTFKLCGKPFPPAEKALPLSFFHEIFKKINLLLTDVPSVWAKTDEKSYPEIGNTITGVQKIKSIFSLIFFLIITLSLSGSFLVLFLQPDWLHHDFQAKLADHLYLISISEILYVMIFQIIFMAIAAMAYSVNKYRPLAPIPLWKAAPIFSCIMTPTLTILILVLGFGISANMSPAFSPTNWSLVSFFIFNLMWRTIGCLSLQIGWRNQEERDHAAKGLAVTIMIPYLAAGITFVAVVATTLIPGVLVQLLGGNSFRWAFGTLYYFILGTLTLAEYLWMSRRINSN